MRIGRYEVLRTVASAGMAEVSFARMHGDGGFSRPVALKCLHRHFATVPPVLAAFQHEATLLAKLDHPGIVQVFDLGQTQATWFMALEWVNGFDLHALWRRGVEAGRVMPIPVSVAVVMEVALALDNLHRLRDDTGAPLRAVHRDVAPGNIMVSQSGAAKLLDFGVAKSRWLGVDETGVTKGTLGYMAPEQLRGEPVDARTDIFALGVVLYELTTGTRLFPGNDVTSVLGTVEGAVPPPAERMPQYPPDLANVVLRALSKLPGARFPSAMALHDALEQVSREHGWPTGSGALRRYLDALDPAAAGISDRPGFDGDDPSTVTEAIGAGTAHVGLNDDFDAGSQVDWPTPAVFDFAFLKPNGTKKDDSGHK
jgi:serine/threonine protein kinase